MAFIPHVINYGPCLYAAETCRRSDHMYVLKDYWSDWSERNLTTTHNFLFHRFCNADSLVPLIQDR